MGFRRRFGATSSCRVHNGFVEVENCDVKYKTGLGIETDWQRNMFRATNVMFLIIYEGDLFIGLNSGLISRVAPDGLLKDMFTWQVPDDGAEVVGYATLDGTTEVYTYPSQPRVLHVCGYRKSFIVADGIKIARPTEYSHVLKEAVTGVGILGVEKQGGGLIEQGYWQDDEVLSSVPFIEF